MDLVPRSKANWDTFSNRAFCEICAEECEAGNRPTGCLSTTGYKNLQLKFFQRTGKKHDQKQLKNHWETLKKEYNLWIELKEKSTGLGWDPIKGTFTADDACVLRDELFGRCDLDEEFDPNTEQASSSQENGINGLAVDDEDMNAFRDRIANSLTATRA
ncbi:hypothetical protein OsJ_33203 [Oryza sativa Japonica Group]|uniref:Myb/SANT-like domain-containing protein n=1 Tax=Oryza sativa subsp. japonica TaxID=39947 RepID=A3C997_ORYSJ|nr:hypothetical protein OsJ_33203 [Oryza sativa Japonica Group]